MRTAILAVLLGTLVLAGCAPAPPAQTQEPTALAGEWVLESFGTPQGMTGVDPRVPSVIRFVGSEEATGYGGVNAFKTTYSASGPGKIVFGPISSTKMAGASHAMEQEAGFFNALEKARTFELSENKLVLGDQGNNTLAILVAK